MRKFVRRVVVVGIGVALGAGVLAAQQAKVSADEGWVKLPAAGSTTAEAFVSVSNPTMYDIYLLSATTDVADKVEFRATANKVVAEVTVPAYGALGMDSDGMHMLLTDLTRPLEEDERISITIKTDGEPITVLAVVRKE